MYLLHVYIDVLGCVCMCVCLVWMGPKVLSVAIKCSLVSRTTSLVVNSALAWSHCGVLAVGQGLG